MNLPAASGHRPRGPRARTLGRFLLSFLLLPLLFAISARAHVGSPNVIFEGNAGPHPVRVVIRPPQVVPGLAEISIRALAPGVERITVLPVHWRAGKGGSPPPDDALLVRGETNLYHATLWLMASGAYTVNVHVTGAAGAGDVMVPVNSIATARLAMPPWYGGLLIALASLLFLAAVKLVGAAWGEALLAPADPIVPEVRRRSRLAMAGATLLFTAAVFGGKAWWDAVDRDYRNNRLYRPVPVHADVRLTNNLPILRLRVELTGTTQRHWTPLQPDHGKLVHLFLIRSEEPDTFAHLHPLQRNSTTFETPLPPLPGGNYTVIADLTHETGFTQTLVASADLPDPPAAVNNLPRRAGASDPFCGVPVRRSPSAAGAVDGFDPDDSWHFGDPVPAPGDTNASTCLLPGGYVMHWHKDLPLLSRRETSLRFSVTHSNGSPAPLQPYIGMAGHAAIRHADGGVFAHLHPAGTISMAAQEAFVRREARRLNQPTPTTNSTPHLSFTNRPHEVSFPYEFPRPGRHRLWVQVKCDGRVLTGVFDFAVAAPE